MNLHQNKSAKSISWKKKKKNEGSLAVRLSCNVGYFPFFYLGPSLGANLWITTIWDLVIENFKGSNHLGREYLSKGPYYSLIKETRKTSLLHISIYKDDQRDFSFDAKTRGMWTLNMCFLKYYYCSYLFEPKTSKSPFLFFLKLCLLSHINKVYVCRK